MDATNYNTGATMNATKPYAVNWVRFILDGKMVEAEHSMTTPDKTAFVVTDSATKTVVARDNIEVCLTDDQMREHATALLS